MKAAIIAVGSELLGTERLDTNSLRLTAVVERYGWELVGKSVVGDDLDAVAGEVIRRLDSSDLVMITGGLGPTADDLTREAVAAALGRSASIDEDQVDGIRQMFERFGRVMPEVNRRQALVIDGAEVLENRWGTAPGLRLEDQRDRGTTHLFLFPGVPRELHGMISLHLEPWLARATPADRARIERRVLKVACMAESTLEERIAPIYERWNRESISILASPGEVHLVIQARGKPAVRTARLDEMTTMLEELIGKGMFTHSAEETLESVVGTLASSRGFTVSTAESCTGGLIAERLTRVPGSSKFFAGGVVTYSNELKQRLIGVDQQTLTRHGAVSRETAIEMAVGAQRQLRTDYAIAVTGIAGPGGGTSEKPVGTVHLALAHPAQREPTHIQALFPGDRERIRTQTAQLGLDLIRRALLEESAEDQEHSMAARESVS